MFKQIFFLLLLTTAFSSYAQTEDTDSSFFHVSLQDNEMVVRDSSNDIIDSWSFESPEIYELDVNGDGQKEIIVIDNISKDEIPNYTLYLFAVGDVIELIDSLSSGRLEPSIEYSTELNTTIIGVGIPKLDLLLYDSKQDTVLAPRKYYKFDTSSVSEVSSELYSTYIENANQLLSEFPELVDNTSANCDKASKYLSIIFSVYYDYLQAGELSLAKNIQEDYKTCQSFNNLVLLINSQ